jgi:hypothetical protein
VIADDVIKAAIFLAKRCLFSVVRNMESAAVDDSELQSADHGNTAKAEGQWSNSVTGSQLIPLYVSASYAIPC